MSTRLILPDHATSRRDGRCVSIESYRIMSMKWKKETFSTPLPRTRNEMSPGSIEARNFIVRLNRLQFAISAL
jgi:hypothetical protein